MDIYIYIYIYKHTCLRKTLSVGFRVLGLGLSVGSIWCYYLHLGFRVSGLGLSVGFRTLSRVSLVLLALSS